MKRSRSFPGRLTRTSSQCAARTLQVHLVLHTCHILDMNDCMNSWISLVPEEGILWRYREDFACGPSATSMIRLERNSRSETLFATPSHLRSSMVRRSSVRCHRYRHVSSACSSLVVGCVKYIVTCELKMTCCKAVVFTCQPWLKCCIRSHLERRMERFHIPQTMTCRWKTGNSRRSIRVGQSLLSHCDIRSTRRFGTVPV